MQNMDQKPDAPGIPEAYRRAVTEFAAALELDADALMRGERLDCGGTGFWLVHHGDTDPTGLTILTDLGPLPDDPAHRVLVMRQMLERNVNSPAGLTGSYGLMPESSVCVLAMRIALDTVQSGGNAIGHYITAVAQGIHDAQMLMVAATGKPARETASAKAQTV